jgi:adenylate cyclase class IV
MKEYEYNFKVKSIDPFINYCKQNGYKEEIINQKRTVYESINNNKQLARLTINNDSETILDFKNVKYNNGLLKESEESIPIKVKSVEEAITMLKETDFKKVSTLERIRYIYTKEDIKFEIDDYIKPNMKVVAIEGNKDKVDKLYKEIKLLDLH